MRYVHIFIAVLNLLMFHSGKQRVDGQLSCLPMERFPWARIADRLAPDGRSQVKTNTPKTVVQDYWKFETRGGRLTPEGWNKANAFFVRPSSPPKKLRIFVIRGGSSVSDPIVNGSVVRGEQMASDRSVKGSSAQVIVGIERILGEIDSSTLGFRKHTTTAIKEGALFDLVLTDKHWEIGAKGRPAQEITGPLEWRIETDNNRTWLENRIWLNADSAIQYVTHMRESTVDPAVKTNAAETLAILRTNR